MAPAFEVGECSSRINQFPNGLRVMVIDDDPVCLRLLHRQLLQCGFEVTAHQSPYVALDQLRERKDYFDVVLTDVFMPQIDGFQLLQIIRSEMDDIPVIMVSVNNAFDVVMSCLSYGASDYITKPTRMGDLSIIWKHVAKRFLKKGLSPKEFLDQRRKLDNYLRLSKKKGDVTKRGRDVTLVDSDDEHSTSSKKQRLTWTTELHEKFIDAVNLLGVDKAMPKRIHELMNAEGVSREHVASHLQKFRKALYMSNLAEQKRTGLHGSIVPHDQIASYSDNAMPYYCGSHTTAGYVATSLASEFQGNQQHYLSRNYFPTTSYGQIFTEQQHHFDPFHGSSSTRPWVNQPAARFDGKFLSLDPTSGQLSLQNGVVPLNPSYNGLRFNNPNDQASTSKQENEFAWMDNENFVGSSSVNQNPTIAESNPILQEDDDSDLVSLVNKFAHIQPLSPLPPIEQGQSSPLNHSVPVELGESTSLAHSVADANLQTAGELCYQWNVNTQVFNDISNQEFPDQLNANTQVFNDISNQELPDQWNAIAQIINDISNQELPDQSNANVEAPNDIRNQEFSNQQLENTLQFDDLIVPLELAEDVQVPNDTSIHEFPNQQLENTLQFDDLIASLEHAEDVQVPNDISIHEFSNQQLENTLQFDDLIVHLEHLEDVQVPNDISNQEFLNQQPENALQFDDLIVRLEHEEDVQVPNDISNQEFPNQQLEHALQFDDSIVPLEHALDTNAIPPFDGYAVLDELDDCLWMFGP